MTSCDVPVPLPPTDAANPPTTAESVIVESFGGTSDSVDANSRDLRRPPVVWTVSAATAAA